MPSRYGDRLLAMNQVVCLTMGGTSRNHLFKWGQLLIIGRVGISVCEQTQASNIKRCEPAKDVMNHVTLDKWTLLDNPVVSCSIAALSACYFVAMPCPSSAGVYTLKTKMDPHQNYIQFHWKIKSYMIHVSSWYTCLITTFDCFCSKGVAHEEIPLQVNAPLISWKTTFPPRRGWLVGVYVSLCWLGERSCLGYLIRSYEFLYHRCQVHLGDRRDWAEPRGGPPNDRLPLLKISRLTKIYGTWMRVSIVMEVPRYPGL